jgi:hypothetical protein
MATCTLCHQRDADKTGSHLVPFFLMRTVDNVDGRKDRNLELGFELGRGHVTGYFGGGVLPERLEPVFGELSEEDIEKSRSSMIVDRFLCSHCETRLGKLESFYSETLSKNGNDTYQSTEDGFHAFLFWISIFWRLAASENKAYHLTEIDEAHLRIILDGGMDTIDIPDYISRLGKEVTGIRYRVMRARDYVKTNPGWVYLNGDNDRPYCFSIGEFVVALYMDGMDTKTASQPFLGLENDLIAAPLNDCTKDENVLAIGVDRLLAASEATVAFWKEDFKANLNDMCDQVHLRFIKHGTMSADVKQQIAAEISADDQFLGRQYAMVNIVEVITKTMLKFEPYRSMVEEQE